MYIVTTNYTNIYLCILAKVFIYMYNIVVEISGGKRRNYVWVTQPGEKFLEV